MTQRQVNLIIPQTVHHYYNNPEEFNAQMMKKISYELQMSCSMNAWLKSEPVPTNPRETRLRQHYVCSKKVHFATAMMMNALVKRSKDTYETTRPLLMEAFCDEQDAMSEMVDNSDEIQFNLTKLNAGVTEETVRLNISEREVKGVRTTHKSEDAYLAKCNYHKALLNSLDNIRPSLHHPTFNDYLNWRHEHPDGLEMAGGGGVWGA
jgi:hypothetical protein